MDSFLILDGCIRKIKDFEESFEGHISRLSFLRDRVSEVTGHTAVNQTETDHTGEEASGQLAVLFKLDTEY